MKDKTLKQAVDLNQRTEKQRQIIDLALSEPDLTHAAIAERTGSSSSYVSTIHRRYIEDIIHPDSVSKSDIDHEIYEQIVAGIKAAENVTKVKQKYDLELTNGGTKEVDVAVWLEQAGHSFLLDIECKFEDNPIEQDVISSLNYYVENSVADKGVVFAKTGFQKGAKELARKSNTELYTLKLLEKGDLDGRIAKINVDMGFFPITGHLAGVNAQPIDGDPLEDGDQISLETPDLFTPDQRPTGETIWDRLRAATSQHGVGKHHVDIEDRLMLINGEFHDLSSILIEVVEEKPFTESFKMNSYEDYDLYMKNELRDKDGDVELYTIREALSNFVELLRHD